MLEAAKRRAPRGPKALAELSTRYWQPLYGNIWIHYQKIIKENYKSFMK